VDTYGAQDKRQYRQRGVKGADHRKECKKGSGGDYAALCWSAAAFFASRKVGETMVRTVVEIPLHSRVPPKVT